ncbi:MAG: hypothetical protein ACK4UU_09970, partial [Fimbriimonadales bacterium]
STPSDATKSVALACVPQHPATPRKASHPPVCLSKMHGQECPCYRVGMGTDRNVRATLRGLLEPNS